jgi:hypothetical protein
MTAKNKAAQELGRLGGQAGKGKPKNQPPRYTQRCKCGAIERKAGGCTRCENKQTGNPTG